MENILKYKYWFKSYKIRPSFNDIIKNQSDKRIQFLKIVLQTIIRPDDFET